MVEQVRDYTRANTGLMVIPPYSITVRITDEGDSKFVTILSRIHVRREARVPVSFPNDFTDHEILTSPVLAKHLRRYSWED